MLYNDIMDSQQAVNQTPPTQQPQNYPSFRGILNKRLLIVIIGGVVILGILIFSLGLVINSFRGGLISSQASPTPIDGNSSAAARKITRVKPSVNAIQADYTGNIVVTFSENVSVNNTIFTTIPSTQGSTTQVNPNSVSFNPASDLKELTKYTVKVTWKAADGKTFSYTWSFTTDEASGEESFTPQEALQFQKIREAADKEYAERKRKFPFLTQLPYSTPHFLIEITNNDSIVVTTYAGSPEEHQVFLEEAKKWLGDNGGDLSTLIIQHIKGE